MPPEDDTHNPEDVQKIHELTITDDCTGLYNARHLNFMLDTEVSRCERYNLQFSLAAITLEGVRELEVSLGRVELHKLFAEVAQPIKAACRLIDLAFHYGDGEFLVLLPQTSKEAATGIIHHLKESLVAKMWLTEQGHEVRLDVGNGVVTWPEDGRTKVELLHSLDKTMYLAKNSTRNAGSQRADERLGMNMNSDAAGPGNSKTLTQFRTVLTVVLAVALFAWFIWPTRYRYDHIKMGSYTFPVRIDRLSGRTEALYPGGWRVMGDESAPTSKP
ncbi:MAG: GGDEF domain-containing protein [Candidatus Acidiferrales bacterium]